MSSSAAQSPSAAPATSAPVATPATSTPVAASATSATPTSPSATSTTPATTASSSAASSAISSSSSSASSSVSSTGSSSVAPSTTASTSTPSSAPRTSSSSSLSFILQTSNGQVFTQTAVVTVPAFTPTTSQSPQSSTSFFHNTGAVAGVFSAVGVIGLIAIFFLLTSFVRRRRARKFDREIDEAAAAAAASAHAPDFDDYDFTSGGTGYGHYSETSHGTFSQPPLSHDQSHNNLGDIPTYEPYGGAGGAVAGAAGIGARGRSVRAGGQPDPYGALANPPEQYEMYETRRSWHQGNPQGGPAIPTYDLLQAAGLAGSDPYAVTRRTSSGLPMLPGQSQPGNNGLNRSQSKGASVTLPTTAETYPTSTPAPGYPGGQDTPYPPEKARYSASYAPAGGVSTMPPDIDEDPYSGYNEPPSAPLDNPHSPGIVETHAHEDGLEDVVEQYQDGPFLRGHEEPARASIADDEDYGYNSGRRVLRVANE